MTAVDILVAAGYLLLVGYATRAVCRRLPGGRPKRTRADIERDVAAYRARRAAQLEQPLAQQYPELDHQLDQYANRISSLYAEGERDR